MSESTKKTSLIRAGKLAGQIHQAITDTIGVGVNVLDIEELAARMIKEAGLKPAFQGYKGYPAVTCISINEEIVHGLPRRYALESGDIVKVDLGVNCDGWLVDTARTHLIDEVDDASKRLLAASEAALTAAIDLCRDGVHVGSIGATVEKIVTDAGFAVVRDLTGHGIGRTLQESPSIPNFGHVGRGPILHAGQAIAIEPITSVIPTDIALLKDGWTIIATEPTISVHVEHTILITDGDPIVLTSNQPLEKPGKTG